MTRALWFALVALFLSAARRAHAQDSRYVAVRVLEIAGPSAYLSKGRAEGLRVGSRVRFARMEHRVQKLTRSFAVVSARRLRVGDRGTAIVTTSADRAAPLPTPRPLEAFAQQWPERRLPSEQQQVKQVALGPMASEPQRTRLVGSLSASGAGMLPLEGAREGAGRGELRGRFQLTSRGELPLRASADIALQRWLGRYASGVARGDARPLVRVRELALELGARERHRAELGRLRYASIHLGSLDGGRLEAARVGPLRVAAFGGAVANPISGRAEWGTGRFGLELELGNPAHALRPELTLVLQGSVFEGRIDERRLYAHTELWPSRHRIAAYAEAARFDGDNPWRRPTLDLTQAGFDVDLRFEHGRLGGRFDLRKPERSYWLASFLPATWLCAGASALDPALACTQRDDTRYVAQAYGGLEGAWLMLDFGGSYVGSSQRELGQHALGYATLRLPRLRGRYDLALGGSHEGGSLLRASSALRGELGIAWLDERLRLDLYYRPAYQRYQASLAPLWEQGLGASLRALPTSSLTLDLRADARIGFVDAVIVMALVGYRIGG